MINSESTSLSPISVAAKAETQKSEITDNYMGEFYQIRNSLLLGTIIVALIGTLITWWLFSWHTSLNYLLGALFGLVYLNMLAKAVEKISEKKKGIGKTRLVMFIGLVVVAAKIQALEILPIFIGFVSYKVTILFYMLALNLLAKQNKSEQKT